VSARTREVEPVRTFCGLWGRGSIFRGFVRSLLWTDSNTKTGCSTGEILLVEYHRIGCNANVIFLILWLFTGATYSKT